MRTGRRRTTPALLIASALVAALTLPAATADATAAPAHHRIAGFTARHSAWEAAYEKAFAALPTGALARKYTVGLTSRPGLLATAGDWQRVQYVMHKLRSFGLHPELKTYYTYLSVPKKVSVRMTKPYRFHAANKERKRPWQRHYDEVVVGYNALSPSGNVTAPVVYVNYGTPADYARLSKLGVSVKGKIAIARYGSVFRGVKAHEADKRGAVGVLIYSDPADDGYVQGPVYPKGPWRPADGIQRGSIQYLWTYPGDPLTPGHAATRHAKRLDPAKARDLPRIPTTPLSWASAKPILANLHGPAAPKSWQGGLPFRYHVGPGRSTVHLHLKIAYRVKPIWNVLVHLRGTKHPEQQVMLGGHRDAWTYGSNDDGTGSVNALQIARGLGLLVKKGWRPDRTITLAWWDGEEYGLYGSTEYAEQRAAQLRNVVAFLNMDIAGGKFFFAGAVPSLDRLLLASSRRAPWPGYSSLYAAWSAQYGGKPPTVDRLGSGSDYTAYLERYGVPAADFGADTPGGYYHCSCDDVYWMNHFGDPTYRYHVGVTTAVGVMTLRLANANVPDFDYATYAAEVGSYLRDLAGEQPGVWLRSALRAAKAWEAAAARLSARTSALLRSHPHASGRFDAITRALMANERALLVRAGIPSRHWYRHQLYAPGKDTGYAAEFLPGIRDALAMGNRARAQWYVAALTASLRRATAQLEQVS